MLFCYTYLCIDCFFKTLVLNVIVMLKYFIIAHCLFKVYRMQCVCIVIIIIGDLVIHQFCDCDL